MRAMLLMLLIGGSASLVGSPLRFDRGHTARAVRMVSTSPVAAPKAATTKMHDWEVHKFGGASLATAALYEQCSDLLIAESRRDPDKATPTMAVVSAKGGVTDRLIAVVNAALHDGIDEASRLLHIITSEQIEVIRTISSSEVSSQIAETIHADEQDIINVVRAVALLRQIPSQTMDLVTGYGEVWSARTMHAYLLSEGVPTACLDAREVLIVEQNEGGGLGEKGSANVAGTDPIWTLTSEKVAEWFGEPGRENLSADGGVAPVVVVTGFVAATEEGVPTTLKRSGSDYSATIFARLMGASRITMWKNVNGVYIADPRRVPEAFSIETLKYDEAIELAHFGAQVLHPSAMMPCIEGQIPIYVRNVFNPSHPGTVIQGRAVTVSEAMAKVEACGIFDEEACADVSGPPIRGVTSVDNVAILHVEGTGTSSVPDLATRFFATLAKTGVAIVMATQASSDASLCVAVEEGVVEGALRSLEAEFERELSKGLLATITVERGRSVVAVVGEGIAFRPSAAAFFTKAMATAGVSIRAIAQGSSERQISICVDREVCTKALRAAHAALALSRTSLSVAVIGASGQVGRVFLEQLLETQRLRTEPEMAGKRKVIDELRLDFKVTALARSGAMRLSYDGIDVSAPEGELYDRADELVYESDLERLTDFLEEDYNGNKVVIDCSASQAVADYYERWLRQGVHVVAANKRMGSWPLDVYDECKVITSEGRAQLLYEVTAPGSGLPVLTTLQTMMQSGDRVHSVSGLFSGSISYILAKLRDGMPFSKALREAVDQGLCEPDPRDDLNGIDVTRQLVVLARELGLKLELGDVECETLLPQALAEWTPDTSDGAPTLAAQLCDAIEPFDTEMAERVRAMREEGTLPVQLATVDVRTGKAAVQAFAARPESCRLVRGLPNEVIIEIESRRYSASPMVLQGPGAGLQITAAGLFSDLLQLSRSLVEWDIPLIKSS